MKKILLIISIAIMANIFSACCGGFPGSSGIRCDNYKASRQIFVTFNFDSINNGFKINELDSTYGVMYEADSVNNFIIPIDTFVFVNASKLQYSKVINFYQYGIYLIDNQLKVENYQLKKSLKIFNSNSNKVYEITNIEVELLQNEKKCCQEYIDNNIKSYKLNGIPKTGNTTIIIDKK